MEWKRRTLWAIVISFIFGIFSFFFMKLGPSLLIITSIFFISYIIFYFFIDKLDIRFTSYIFPLIFFVCVGISYLFINSNRSLKIDINYWERIIKREKILIQNEEYKIIDRTIFDQNNNEIYSFKYLKPIVEGYVIIDSNGKATYQLSFQNKCVVKKDNNIVIKENLC